MSESSRPITVVVGKGGVGKTTVAAAYALSLADAGLRTLLLSTDPAHSLSDVLRRDIGDRAAEVAPLLWAREPDADAAVQRRVREVTRDAEAIVPPQTMPAVRRHLEQATAGPGMLESATADLLVDAMATVPGDWDRLVVDSAPTGHLVRLLRLPDLLVPWVQGLARRRESAVRTERFADALVGPGDTAGSDAGTSGDADPLLQRLHGRRAHLQEAGRRLREDAELRLVLLPQRMVVSESERAVAELRQDGIPFGRAVINQVPDDPDPVGLDAARTCVAAAGGVDQLPRLGSEPIGPTALRELFARRI